MLTRQNIQARKRVVFFSQKELKEMARRASSLYEKAPGESNGWPKHPLAKKWAELLGGKDKLFKRFSLDHLSLPLAFGHSENINDAWTKTFAEIVLYKPKTCLPKGKPVPFEELLLPFAGFAKELLQKKLGKKIELFNKRALVDLDRSLLKRLSWLFTPVLYAEFVLYRWQKGQGGLFQEKGLYKAFVKGFSFKSFFLEYPVLARLLVETLDNWKATVENFLCRFQEDQKELEKKFQIKGKIEKIQNDSSDLHNGGQSVWILSFSEKKLVYKPRNIDLDSAFFSFLDWIQKHSAFSFKTLKTLSRSNYGWEEYAPFACCKKKEEIREFSLESGRLLAVFYCLQGSDLHLENLIACGKHPLFVDLETLLQPISQNLETDFLPYNRFIQQSVLNTLLLPAKGSFIHQAGIEISGLAGDAVQKGFTQTWKEINQDGMHPEKAIINSQEKNLPHWGKKKMPPIPEAIEKGFEEMFLFFLKNKQAILRQLQVFKGKIGRYVCRDTATYAKILKASLFPNCMRDGLYRSFTIDQLAKPLLSDLLPFFDILKKEHAALTHLDIPYFSFLTDSQKLDSINAFTNSGYETIVKKIENLNLEELELQKKLIRYSLGARYAKADYVASSLKKEQKMPAKAISFYDKALAIGEELLQKMLPFSSFGIWLQAKPTLWGNYELDGMDLDLYSGNCGIALFLAALYKQSKDKRFLEGMKKALYLLRNNIKKNWFQQQVSSVGIGGCAGLGSYIYAFSKIGQFLVDPKYFEEAEEMARYITKERIHSDHSFDVILGSAGTILGLLSLYKCTHNKELLQKALLCAEHLKNSAIDAGHGKAWKTAGENNTFKGKCLLGFAHGVSGICYALFRLYECQKTDWILPLISAGLAYERNFFSRTEKKWPDFRKGSFENRETRYPPSHWCHGALGIGLTRLTLRSLDGMEQEWETALKAVQKSPLLARDHICCGNFSKVEFFLEASRKLQRKDFLNEATKLTNSLIQKPDFSLISSPIPVPSYGFFQGLAGIGYSLLRFVDPTLPSVLLLE